MRSNIQTVRVILNPKAAKGKAAKYGNLIITWFKNHNSECELVYTERVWHAAELAEQAVYDKVSIIAAAGGDGTLNEVVNGMLSGRAKLGEGEKLPGLAVIPVGRGNDFAFAAKLTKNVEEACSLILRGKTIPVDIGWIAGGNYPQGRFFHNGIGVGFEPMVTMAASDMKHVSGILSYLLALMKIIAANPPAVQVSLIFEGAKRDIITQQISVSNGRRMGGLFLLGPDAQLDDGNLNFSYVNRPVKVFQIIYLAFLSIFGKHIHDDRFTFELIKEIEITASSNCLICHADGEVVSRGTDNLKVKIISEAVTLISK